MENQKISLDIAVQLANLFGELSDPTRIQILSILSEGEVGVSTLVQQLGLSKSAISHQLRGLRQRKVIKTRKQGRNVFVCLDDEHIFNIYQRGLDHILHSSQEESKS